MPKCSVYPTTIELDKIPTKLSLLTLNIDSNIKNINSLEKLPHIYEKIKNYDVISLQNVGNNENRIGLIDLLINSHQYRIVAPRVLNIIYLFILNRKKKKKNQRMVYF